MPNLSSRIFYEVPARAGDDQQLISSCPFETPRALHAGLIDKHTYKEFAADDGDQIVLIK